ncbi:hypothetical protein HYALB_00004889 [Hymenoscyphus albidus]|uniref:Aldehyde dehydrogenase domain-containing protein n=1 Tax=Hymenoscyphus albidus TaxID=595503 RepID=A0A9N9Q6U5_9HELO|nr:hypothetical protein HYALB_00004889 [Hymenoscyphus albidus]
MSTTMASPQHSNGTNGTNGTNGHTKNVVVPLWINGKEETTFSSFEVTSPSNNEVCWTATSASKDDALRAVSSAEAAFPSWSETKPVLRRDILLETAALLEARTQEYAGFMQTEMGADMGVAAHFVMPLAISQLKDIAGRITSICGSVPVCQEKGRSAIVYKEPYGVTLGICPWNAPFVFGIRSAATAIATGNTTILKASEVTPRSYWAISKAFHDAGLPAGVLNVIQCRPTDAAEVTNTLIEHTAVKKIDFTGSASVGRKIAKVCGQMLKPCLMELGGKNSTIVLQDADIEKAVGVTMAGSFLNSGQICMATDRIILHSQIAPQFLAAFKSALSSAPDGKQPPLPTLVSSASKKRLGSIVDEAINSGAKSLIGRPPKGLDGASFAPVILGHIAEDSLFWREENFGPAVGYLIVDSEEEAITAANKTEYGLSASVFTKDLRRGLAVAKKIQSGAVHINNMTIHDEPTLPFGGVKNSGWGRFNAQSGMEEFLVTKTVTWDD